MATLPKRSEAGCGVAEGVVGAIGAKRTTIHVTTPPAEDASLPSVGRRTKKRRRLAQDLVGLAQLAHFALQGLAPRLLVGRQPRPQPTVPLGPTDPRPQRLCLAADLPGHRRNRRPLGAGLALVIQDHPHRPFTHLGCVPRQFVAHGSIPSRFGASGKGGAIQEALQDSHCVLSLPHPWIPLPPVDDESGQGPQEPMEQDPRPRASAWTGSSATPAGRGCAREWKDAGSPCLPPSAAGWKLLLRTGHGIRWAYGTSP